MRVNDSNLIEITKSNSKTEVKGNVAVTAERTTARQVEKSAGEVRSVQQTTVDRPFFSGDSENGKVREETECIEAQRYKEKMDTLVNSASEKDCARMEEDGFSVNDTDVDTIVTEMDKIKMELAKAGVDISVFGDDVSLDKLKEMMGETGAAYQMEQVLRDADLPATEENVSDCQETVKQAADLKPCSEETVKYMVENELEPTVGNLYKAQHSTSSGNAGQMEQETPMDESLKKQVENVIAQAGLPVNEKTLGYSQWMMDHEIPLTAKNLNYVSDLCEMEMPPDAGRVMDAMAAAVSEGNRPADAVILEGYSLKDRADQAVQIVAEAADEDVWTVVEKGQPVTIENLKAAENQNQPKVQNQSEAQNQDEESAHTVPEYAKEDIRYITARRQLEEIRLMMTAQASHSMMKQGIDVETKPLEELVEQLKSMEQDYYKNLLNSSGIEPTEENAALLAETVEKTEELKNAPAYVLGNADLKKDTVNTLCETGAAMKEQQQRAGQAYETLMTEPRADLGDSIQKAFQNVDDILVDLGMERTPANQRAVRILAYNQLEITPESVNQIKSADLKVQVLFQNLSPSVVMEMIREGINPLEQDVNQLNARAEEIKNRIDAGGEEKFSKYLWKLEQNNELTKEQRDSYIGIYRLLNQIDKTDGAVIGALVNQGADLSMKNLLSAVRTRQNAGIDASVDDSFGETDTVNTQELSISQQIAASYQTDCAKEAFSRMSPEGMEQAQSQGNLGEMTPEQLLWQLRNTQTDQGSEEKYYQEQLKQFSMAKEAEAQVIRMLTTYDMPVTAYNVLAANQMVNNRSGVFKNLFEHSGEEPDLAQVKEDILKDFAEALETPEDMAKAQKKLADTAENVMNTMAQAENVQSFDIRDLKIMRQQIELGTRMSKEENYFIPVLVADELTNVQLKIVRGTEKRGRVDVIFDSPKLGKVAARFQVQGEKVRGSIVSDSGETADKLKEQEDSLLEGLSLKGSLNPSLDIIRSEELELSRFSFDDKTYKETPQPGGEEYQVQTRTLYGMAKEFIGMVKQIGKELQ